MTQETATLVQALAAVVLVVITGVLAGITAFYARQTNRQADAAYRVVEEMRLTRRAQYRPMVVADLEVDRERRTVEFVVRNVGPSIARSVRIRTDPTVTNLRNPDLSLDKRPLITEGIPTLVPGKEVRTVIATLWDPCAFRVEVSYTDDQGQLTFDESFDLDAAPFVSTAEVDQRR